MLVSDVLLLVRYATGDMDDSKTSYYQKMNAINAANRFIRKVAFDIKPTLLETTETQNTSATTAEYTLTNIPNRIKAVRIDGDKIDPTNKDDITDLTETGKPTGYYMTAYNKITFWPIPDDTYSFSVYMVKASTDLAEGDTLPWTDDMGDVITAYASGLLTGSLDSAGMEQEARRLLDDLEPVVTGVQGYYDEGSDD